MFDSPLQRIKPSYRKMAFYVTMMISTVIMMNFFIFPCKNLTQLILRIDIDNFGWTIAVDTMFAIVNLLFLLTCFKDPGHIKSSNAQNFLELVKNTADPT